MFLLFSALSVPIDSASVIKCIVCDTTNFVSSLSCCKTIVLQFITEPMARVDFELTTPELVNMYTAHFEYRLIVI